MSVTKYRTAAGAPRWRVTWRLPDGRSRSKVFGTLREARAFEAEAITARTRGVVFDPRRGDTFTVAAVYASWLATRQDVTPKSRRGFTDNWRLHVAPAFGAWPVTKVDRESIQTWVNAMDCSPRTKRWRHSLLRMILAHAVADGLLVKNPAGARCSRRWIWPSTSTSPTPRSTSWPDAAARRATSCASSPTRGCAGVS